MNVFNVEKKMDKIEIIGKSTLQHGHSSNRVYLMDFQSCDFPQIIEEMENLANNNGYTKIFAKIPSRFAPKFFLAGYVTEAIVPCFFNGIEDALFLVKYKDLNRSKPNIEEMNSFQELLLSQINTHVNELDSKYQLRQLNHSDTNEMTEVFSQVFKTYPFPIFDTKYLDQEMKLGTRYFGVFMNDNLVGISSAECNDRSKNVEMTDFAILPSQRGKKLATHLLMTMEKHLIAEGFKSFYTIARLKSLSMNKTFMNSCYSYSGTLINNTQIAGQIESMNVWYKTV